MGLFKEFKEFATRGNVVDLAIGVIIGGTFGKIVSSLVADILMPPIGYLIGGINFSELKITLLPTRFDPTGAVQRAAVTLNLGNFIQSLVDFSIIAFTIFLIVKLINMLQKKEETSLEPPADIKLLIEIRDLLKKRR